MEMATNLCRKMVEDNNLPAEVIGTTDRREALRGADYVISTVRVGGLVPLAPAVLAEAESAEESRQT